MNPETNLNLLISEFLEEKYQLSQCQFQFTIPKNKDHGQLSCNVALILSKQINLNARDLANSIKNDIPWPNYIQNIEIAGAGFINFYISEEFYAEILKLIHQLAENYGRSTIGLNKKTLVEFVSANPTGPLTVGHARNAVLGDTIARILEANAYHVTREYYFNNAGRQMRVLGHSVYYRYCQLFNSSVIFPDDHYEGDYIIDIAKVIYNEFGKELEQDKDNIVFRKKAEELIFEDIKKSLSRIGIIHDTFYNEQDLYDNGNVDAVLSFFKDAGLSYEKDSAIWLNLKKLGLEQDRVIIKSTGEATYRLPDIAYHKDKFDRGFELMIDLFGADHIDAYPDVLAAISSMNYDSSKVRVLIYQFVTLMRNNEVVKMSTRKANYVTMDELLDEVGADVLRYFINMRSYNSHLNFDLDLAKKQSDENPVFYVQYAHARICSILRNADVKSLHANHLNLNLLSDETEKQIINHMSEFPKLISKLADSMETHKLCTYLFDLASLYHHFNQKHRVIDIENQPLSSARLYLIQAVKQVLANGFKILGISAPERM